MINIADELNAATEQAILGRAAQIMDTSLNKTQATINAETQAALAGKASTADIEALLPLIYAGL